MSDTIGRITVPTVVNSGQTFPLTTQYPFGFSVERPVIVHRFGSLRRSRELTQPCFPEMTQAS
jgi:hypothetical protein